MNTKSHSKISAVIIASVIAINYMLPVLLPKMVAHAADYTYSSSTALAANTAPCSSGVCTYDNLTVNSGVTLTVPTTITSIVINGNATIEGTISANGQGGAGGATGVDGTGTGGGKKGTVSGNMESGGGGGSYGGSGGAGGSASSTAGGAAGSTYGTTTSPAAGSGGGGGADVAPGGNGGGYINLTVAGTLTVNGAIRSNGNAGSGGWTGGGGGSGGGIKIITNGLALGASGAISANGGNGGNNTVSNTGWILGAGGGGGGGRIYVVYDSLTGTLDALQAKISVSGGTGGTKVDADGSAGADGSSGAYSAGPSNSAPSLALGAISQTADGTKYVTINYTVSDDDSDALSLTAYEYSTDNSGWSTMTEKSGVGSDGTSGLTSSSEGTAHEFMWDVGTDLANTEDSTVYIRLTLNDGTVDSDTETSSSFSIDTYAPRVATTTDITSRPTVGNTTVTIDGAFTDANPNTNSFYVKLNGGSYTGATSGDSNTADPSALATAADATLDGNDCVTAAKIVHIDDFGNSATNENTSPSLSCATPYTPAAMTVSVPTNSSVSVAVNANGFETEGLDYAIYETSQSRYVQADGTLGASAIWQTTVEWGTTVISGLSSPVANYSFRSKSRNTQDTSVESALSSAASITNSAPSVSIGSISQTNNGTKYVTINYTATDAQSDTLSLATYEYSTDNLSWSTMTEKAGVSSDGTSGLASSSGGTAHDYMWDVGTDLADTEDSTVYVRLVLNDGITTSAVSTSEAFEIDTLVPTAPSSLGYENSSQSAAMVKWTAGSDGNFDHYEIWYGVVTADIESRTGTAYEWDDSDSATLASATTSRATINGLNNSTKYYFKIWAVDAFGNESPTPQSASSVEVTTQGSQSSDSSDSGNSGTSAPSASSSSGTSTDINKSTTVQTTTKKEEPARTKEDAEDKVQQTEEDIQNSSNKHQEPVIPVKDISSEELTVSSFTLLDGVFSGKVTPGKDNPSWTAHYENNKPTESQKIAYSFWESYLKGLEDNGGDFTPNERYTLMIKSFATLMNIFSGVLEPSKENTVWTSLYENGKPTEQQKISYRAWQKYLQIFGEG